MNDLKDPSSNEHHSAGRIPALDGLRALSIIIVLVAHSFMLWAPVEPLPKYFSWIAFNGRTGVSIFFVISGFLITYLLCRERRATGRISLTNFYIRRVLRIFPAYYLYLLVFFILVGLGYGSMRWVDAISAVFFVHNWLPSRDSWGLGHLWSVNVEEQFYLLWPGVLVALGEKRALRCAVILTLGNPLIRLLSDYIPGIQNHQIPQTVYFNLDYLMTGAILGICYGDESFHRLANRMFDMKLHWVAAFLLFIVSPILLRTMWNNFLYVQGTIEAPCIGLLILWCVLHSASGPLRYLNARIPVFIGSISYGLYLWQQPFMPKGTFGVLGLFPINIAIIFSIAILSYYLVERRFLLLRRNYRRVPEGSDTTP